MAQLTFNRQHKNGWLSWKLQGVPGAVFVDKRMLSPETLANPPQTLEIDIPGMLPPGAGVSEAQAQKAAKKLEAEQKKAERAKAQAEKATARLAKLQEQAAKATAAVEAAKNRTTGAPGTEGAPAEGVETPASL